MIGDILAILRLDDEEILRLYREEPSLPVLMAMQERIWDLHTLNDPYLVRFTTSVHAKKVEDFVPDLHSPQLMLKAFCRNLFTKTHRIREAQRKAEVRNLAQDKPFQNLLTYMVLRRRFTKGSIVRHLEHRQHLHVFERCMSEDYIKVNLLTNAEGEETYYTTWKAQTLVSDWTKYDLDKTSD